MKELNKKDKKDKNGKFLHYNFFKKNRRGDDKTTALIVTFIVLIVSFIIILYFIFVLNPAKTSTETICHNSVLTRSAGVLPAESIPLNCKTDYICLSKDGTCERMTGPEIIKTNTLIDVYDALAEQMAKCWWMFGEGKLNYLGKEVEPQLYCSICSQVAFDNSLNNIFPSGKISKANFYDYLAYNKVSGKDINYLDYLVGAKSSQDIKNYLKQDNPDLGKIDIAFGNMSLEKQYFVMMGQFSDVAVWRKALGFGAAGATIVAGVILIVATGGAALPTLPFIIAVSSGFVAGTTGGYFIAMSVKGESGLDYISPTIIEANSEDYNKLQCADIKTLA
jgi:hypothetical protein